MSTPQIFVVAAVLLGFSIGPSAGTVGSAAESHSVESKDSIPTKSINETPIASMDAQEELNVASTSVNEAVVDLVNALKERLKDDPLVDYITEDAVSENQSIIEKYDSDGDGGLSKEELENGLKDMTDEYNSLTPDERREMLEEEFKECDQDEDGKISLEELSIYMAETIYVIETVVKNYASQKLNEEGTTSSNESEAEGRSD